MRIGDQNKDVPRHVPGMECLTGAPLDSEQISPHLQRDPLTGFYPPSLLRTQEGIDHLNAQLSGHQKAILRFRDQSGLSILERFGFYGTADILLAMLKPVDNDLGLMQVRIAGDELADIVPSEGGREKISDYDRLIEFCRDSVLGQNLTVSGDLRIKLAKILGWNDRDVISVMDKSLHELLLQQMKFAQEFADHKAGFRSLRQHYTEQAGVNASIEGFKDYLNQNFISPPHNEEVLTLKHPVELLREVVESHPELQGAPKVGSFEGAMIEIDLPLTVEKVKKALVQAEILFHQVKHSPKDEALRAELSIVHPLNEAYELRDADNRELELSSATAEAAYRIDEELQGTQDEALRGELIKRKRFAENADPALNEVVRCSRLFGETLQTVVPDNYSQVMILDLRAFQVLNNTIGYSRADELFGKVVEKLRKDLPPGVFGRLSGGALCYFSGPQSVDDLHDVLHRTVDFYGELIQELPAHVRAKIDLELIERDSLNQLAGEMEVKQKALIGEKFEDNSEAAGLLVSRCSFVKDADAFPSIRMSIHGEINPSKMKFEDLVELQKNGRYLPKAPSEQNMTRARGGKVVEELIEAGSVTDDTHDVGVAAKSLIAGFPASLNFEPYKYPATGAVLERRIKTFEAYAAKILTIPEVDGVVFYGSSLWAESPNDIDTMELTCHDTDRAGDMSTVGSTPTEERVEKALKDMHKELGEGLMEIDGRSIPIQRAAYSQFDAYGWGPLICPSGPFLVIYKTENGVEMFGSVAGTKALQGKIK